MGRAPGAEIEAQLRNARSRLATGTIDGSSYESSVRLFQLRKSLQTVGPGGDTELFRYFPVAAIATLESQFKSIVTATVDAGSPYLERGLSLARDRLRSAADVVPLLHRKVATIGELVAYALPFNSISTIESALRALWDVELKSLVAQVRDPYDERNQREDSKTLVPDADLLWRQISEAFERRHVLAHEGASKFEVSYEDARQDIQACELLMQALDAVMWASVWKDVPLTQYEMNVESWRQCRASRETLSTVLRDALATATADGGRPRLRRLHATWKAFADEWLTWVDETFEGGSMRPMVRANSRETMNKAQADLMKYWLNLMRLG